LQIERQDIAPHRIPKESIMDMNRIVGIAGGLLGILLLAIAWLNAPALLGPLDPTIGGYARDTVLLVGVGVVALVAGLASYLMAKPAI
jgi:hypothetical protein